jgi:4-amino-4-deoxy-L-arabinose transferase-like glycosyltransferase
VTAAVVAVALAALVLLPGLGAAPFDDPGEGQHVQIARELRAGEWATLRLNGVRYFDKPPFLYWLIAGAFAVFGPGEWAARLVPVGGALLAAAATAVLGARLLGPARGAAAAAALCSCALFVVFGRYVRPETLFVAAIQWGFTGLLLGLGESGDQRAAGADSRRDERRRRAWLVVGCAGLAVASLAKDPLGLIGPLAAVAGALWLAGRLGAASRRLPWAGIGVLAVVGLGWYVAAAVQNPGFAWYAIVDNHLLNLVQLRHFPDEDVPLSTPEFVAVATLGAFPWTLAAGLEMLAMARRRAWRDPAETPWVALALWALGLLAFFAVARFKLPHYGLVAYPAIALLAMRHWATTRHPRALIAVHLACWAGLAAAAYLAAAGDGRAFSEVMFSATDVYTRKEAAAGQASPLPPWSALAPLLDRAGLIFTAGTAVLLAAFWTRAAGLGLLAVLGAMLALMPAVTAGAGLIASERAVAGLAADLGRRMAPGDLLVHEGPIENSGAIEFYSGRRPALLDGRKSVLGVGATFPEAAGTFWDASALARAWAADRRVFLVTPRAPDRSLVAALPRERVHLLARRNGRWLYSNLPPNRAGAAPRPDLLPVAGPSPSGIR